VLRGSRIIDGPTACRTSDTLGELIHKNAEIYLLLGVSTARRGLTLVGVHTDAFQVTQIFNWTSFDTSRPLLSKEDAHKLGFREMQESCLQADRLLTYQCDVITTDVWLGLIHDALLPVE